MFVSSGYWDGIVVKFTIHLGRKSLQGKFNFDPYIRITSENKPYHPLINSKNGKISNVTPIHQKGNILLGLIENLKNVFYFPLHQAISNADFIRNEEALSLFSMNTSEFKNIAEHDVRNSYMEMSEFSFKPITI